MIISKKKNKQNKIICDVIKETYKQINVETDISVRPGYVQYAIVIYSQRNLLAVIKMEERTRGEVDNNLAERECMEYAFNLFKGDKNINFFTDNLNCVRNLNKKNIKWIPRKSNTTADKYANENVENKIYLFSNRLLNEFLERF